MTRHPRSTPPVPPLPDGFCLAVLAATALILALAVVTALGQPRPARAVGPLRPLGAVAGTPGPVAPATRPAIPVYDAIFSQGKPSTVALGLSPIAYASHAATTPERLRAHADAAVKAGLPLFLNIHEAAKVDSRKYDAATVDAELATLDHAATVLRERQLGVEFGFYGFPIRDYWTPVEADAARRQLAAERAGRNNDFWVGVFERKTAAREVAERAWSDANDRLGDFRLPGGPLTPAGVFRRVPILYPSIYLFYDDGPSNEVYVAAQVREAKKYGGKVYPVLMPHYHESNKEIGGQPIPPAMASRVVRAAIDAGADGIVIWDGEADWTDGDAAFTAAVKEEAQ